ncbi:MAG: DUF4126 family protein [Candidatus Omnitrophica bacterium]|nr:DUF4126 family protein [Candidatus Omnitrophota bacterium]
MGMLSEAGILAGGAWASGVNLYLTVAGLGIAERAGLMDLPGRLDVLSHPLVITAALVLFAIEFLADKIPYVDSAWDSFHTFIRPAGGAVMAYMASSGAGAEVQVAAALVCGTIALDAHLTKASARVAINTSPEPLSNIAASAAEDASVVVLLWLMARHPVIAGILVLSFLVFSIWFLKVMFRFLKKVLTFFSRGNKEGGRPGGVGS